jgi:hypothetical protein
VNPAGDAPEGVLRPDFDRRVMLQFRGSLFTSDAGLLAYRELDDALGLSDLAGEQLADERTGKNGRHALVGLLRQSVFGRLAGYEDVNDASVCDTIRRCDGSSVAKRLKVAPHHRARWAASRRSGSRPLETSQHLPTFLVSGSAQRTNGDRPGMSCWIWIRA